MNKSFYILIILALLLQSGLVLLPGASAQEAGEGSQAPSDAILYVKPGGTGDCSSWAKACELQTALSAAASGDEIWATQGIYKPTHGIPYASCQEIHDADLTASDGDYLIHNGGNAFQVYCADMASTPKEYLSLDSISNYSQFTAGGDSLGTNVRTNYSKVRLLPETLQVDISDQTFTVSSGSLTHGSTTVTSMPYGVAMDCMSFFSQTGVANVDLRETPFAIDPAETFILGGFLPAGSATFTDNRQVVSLQGGGFCGWIQPEPYIYNPINNTGGPVLELEHILPERRAAFRLKSGVALYGGFTGTETSRDQRNWETNITTMSGDIGVAGNNSYHVITGSGVDATAVLDGFTVTGGNADGGYPASSGGGMYNESSSPTLSNVTFSGNTADYGGGGMYNEESSSPTLSNVTFTSNTAFIGGGMYNYQSSPELTDVTFIGNSAESGGGMCNWDSSSPTLTDVTFSGNTAIIGGGMRNHGNSSPTLTNVTFSGNTAGYGGGMYNWGSGPTLSNVTFSGNTVEHGGGMYNESSSPTLLNVTFSGNSAIAGAGMYNLISNPTLTNAIVWGNTPDQIYNASGAPVVTYSDVQGGYAGTGNIDADPLFVNPAGGNLRLQPSSPAIDAGNNAAVPSGVTTDLDGSPRIVDYPPSVTPVVDMGAYEAQVGSAIIYVDKDAPGPTHDGTSWANAFTGLQSALAAADEGAEIWVAEGVYYPGIGGNRSATFLLKDDVGLYGGFAGTETSREDRNWEANLTLLSGDIGVEADSSDNSYHVVTGSGVDATAVLDGFTVTGGNADGVYPANIGGGMFNYASGPSLANVTFSGNTAGVGGGMGNDDSSSPTLSNVTFSGNTAGDWGGGMYNLDSSPTLINVIFSGNTADFGGGMLNDYDSDPVLNNVTFSGNSAEINGGGMYNDEKASNPTLTNSILWGNTPNQIVSLKIVINYSDIQGGYDGTNNIDEDPLFVRNPDPGADDTWGTQDDDYGDLRLQLTSPAIDAGNNAAVPSGVTTDLLGYPRFADIASVPDTGSGTPPIVDMGAYEAQAQIVFLYLPVTMK